MIFYVPRPSCAGRGSPVTDATDAHDAARCAPRLGSQAAGFPESPSGSAHGLTISKLSIAILPCKFTAYAPDCC